MRKQKVYKTFSDLIFLLSFLFCILSVGTLVAENSRLNNELTDIKAMNDELDRELESCYQELSLQDNRRQLYLSSASIAMDVADMVIRDYNMTANGINSSAQRNGYNMSMATYDPEIAEHVSTWAGIYLSQCEETEYNCTFNKQ